MGMGQKIGRAAILQMTRFKMAEDLALSFFSSLTQNSHKIQINTVKEKICFRNHSMVCQMDDYDRTGLAEIQESWKNRLEKTDGDEGSFKLTFDFRTDKNELVDALNS